MRVAFVILLVWLTPLVSAQVLRSEANREDEAPEPETPPLVLQSAANESVQARTVDAAITRLREQMREIADSALSDAERRDAYNALYESALVLRVQQGVSPDAPPVTVDEAADRLERLFFEVALEAAGTAEARELLLEGAPEHLTLEPVVPDAKRRRPVLILRDPDARGDWWGDAKFDTEALALDEIEESPEEQLEPPEENIEEQAKGEPALAVEVLADEKTTVELHDNVSILREVESDTGDLVLFDALHVWAGGSVQLDAYSYRDLLNANRGGQSEDSTSTRRAEVIVRSTLLDLGEIRLQYDVDAEFWRDLYYRLVDPDRGFIVTAGNQNEPMSQESLLGNKFNAAMEASAPTSTFGSYRGMGLSMNKWFTRSKGESFLGLQARSESAITTAFGIFGEDIENTNDTDLAATGRVTWGRLFESGTGLHLGVSGTYRDGEFDRINPRPEIAEADRIVLARFDADRAAVAGFEAHYTAGSLHASSEFYLADYSGGEINGEGYGGFVEVGYYLTGQQRSYRPRWGLWAPLQVGARNIFEVYGRFSYTYGDAEGQSSNDLSMVTIGGSWYRHKFRTSLGLLYGKTDRNVQGEDDGFGASMRVQYLF